MFIANNATVTSNTNHNNAIGNGTIGTVSGSGPFTATITGILSTIGLSPGTVISATAGTGSFGSGVMSIATIESSTSITVSSTLTFTAGTVTNIIGSVDTGIPIEQYQLKPMFVQAIVLASNDNESEIIKDVNKYTLWSITKGRSTYFDAYAILETNDSSLPYSTNLVSMSLPYSNSDRNMGLRIYSESAKGVSLPPTTTAVDYRTGTSLVIKADSQIPKNNSPSNVTTAGSQSQTLAVGFKTFTVTNTNTAFIPGMRIRVARTANPTVDYMEGIITQSSATSITMYADTIAGATAGAWTISYIAGSLVTSLRL